MNHTFRISNLVLSMAVLALAMTAGCAARPLRTDASSAGIRAAEEVGADELPRASLYLQLAREELEDAEELSKDGDREEAVSMLARSEADAEMALALSRENTEKLAAEEAIARVRKLIETNR